MPFAINRELLGDNIESIGFPSGNISIQNDSGEIDFMVKVAGSNGEGNLIVKGIRADKKWVFEELYLTLPDIAEQVNLLEREKILEGI